MDNNPKTTKKSNSAWIYLTVFAFVLGFLLSFHIITKELKIIPKKSLTFQKTFITQDDEIDILKKIHFGSLIEKSQLRNDELANIIDENWEVFETNKAIHFKRRGANFPSVSIFLNE